MNELESLKKKIKYRSSYRGTKEMDLLLSSFALKYTDSLSHAELIKLDDFMNCSDEDINNFYSKRTPIQSFDDKKNLVFECLAHIKVGSCHRCRYLKQKNLDFACVTPGSWTPDLANKVNLSKRNKDIDSWKKIINSIKT